jgi:uncharacterized sporulation protein YeaH/YhbH (DUF444 family)
LTNNYVNYLTNDELLEKYAITYGKLTFDSSNKNLRDNLEEYKKEILNRLYNVKNLSLSNNKLLTDEEVILHHKYVDEIASKLVFEIKPIIHDPTIEAKVVVVMDTSGSMGSFEKYMARSFMKWNEEILKQYYKKADKTFIAFHTEAKYVGEDTFYKAGESGGTLVSTGLNKANEHINTYDYENKDTYIFIISDGDNLYSDNERSVRIIDDLQRKAKHVSYFEINQYDRKSTVNDFVNKCASQKLQ